jgi:hypothetical protein
LKPAACRGGGLTPSFKGGDPRGCRGFMAVNIYIPFIGNTIKKLSGRVSKKRGKNWKVFVDTRQKGVYTYSIAEVISQ